MLDCYLEFRVRQDGEYLPFQGMVPEFDFKTDVQYFNQIVPTKETVCYQYLICKFLETKGHVFLTGPTGTGKSIIIQNIINSLKNSLLIQMTFSSQTSAQFIQDDLEFKLVQQRKKGNMMLSPPPGKSLVIIIDDVNLPVQEAWGAHPPIELLRQCLDQRGIYDKQGLFFKQIEDLMCLAAAAPPGGGRSNLSQRFTRHFSIFNVQKTSNAVIQAIFGQIVHGYLKKTGFKPELVEMSKSLVKATLSLYTSVCASVLPSVQKSHYIFSLRDVSKVFQAITMSQPQSYVIKRNVALLWAHECIRVFHDKMTTTEVRNLMFFYFRTSGS